MILPSLASPIALAFMLVQDDSAAPSLVGSPGAALLEMVRNSGSIAQGVLVILLLASIFSWAIMMSNWRRPAGDGPKLRLHRPRRAGHPAAGKHLLRGHHVVQVAGVCPRAQGGRRL